MSENNFLLALDQVVSEEDIDSLLEEVSEVPTIQEKIRSCVKSITASEVRLGLRAYDDDLYLELNHIPCTEEITFTSLGLKRRVF